MAFLAARELLLPSAPVCHTAAAPARMARARPDVSSRVRPPHHVVLCCFATKPRQEYGGTSKGRGYLWVAFTGAFSFMFHQFRSPCCLEYFPQSSSLAFWGFCAGLEQTRSTLLSLPCKPVRAKQSQWSSARTSATAEAFFMLLLLSFFDLFSASGLRPQFSNFRNSARSLLGS